MKFNGSDPLSLNHALATFITLLDAVRIGAVNSQPSVIPDDPAERARHIKAAGYYFDASQVGICEIPPDARLATSIHNPDLDALAEELKTAQPNTLASGIDVVMADVREAAGARPEPIDHHRYAVVFLVEHPRQPCAEEPGCDWIQESIDQRSAVRAAETAVVLANYFRIMGFEARAHTVTSSDVDLDRLSIAAGLCSIGKGKNSAGAINPYLGEDYSLAALTTPLMLEVDQPLDEIKPRNADARWISGIGTMKNAFNYRPYKRRHFRDGAYPFEKLKRRDAPTTFIDKPRVPRVPKRTDMFARALFGDMGKALQEGARNGKYILKNPLGYCSRRLLGALILRQDGDVSTTLSADAKDPDRNADNIKGSLYFLGADAVGLSAAPAWTWYSHDAAGDPIKPYHENAISILIDQGFETMEGASGDDWISGAQSMRAYLRTSLIGGIVAHHIRSLGYSARVHSVLDGEILQPPLLLLSGLGEVSRIGEVILNPFLGPRLKSGVVTTDMPMRHDRPIDFGLQNFCENCNKCARECPSGAITAGPKLMFNGYEIWKSDSEKCARYRIGQTAGSMCGRCMKTCPWNLEGIFSEAPFRALAMRVPRAARWLAKFDDAIGRGRINPVKKWWWDIELTDIGNYVPAMQTNQRELNLDLDLKYEDQTLAVYPADLTPPPYPFPFPMDREKGIKAYQRMLEPTEYRARLARGEVDGLVTVRDDSASESPVIATRVSRVIDSAENIKLYEFRAADGGPLPPFEAGAHIDVVVAPEFFRQYSLAGNPLDNDRYLTAVLNEQNGRGGSALMHRMFNEGRRVFVSRPINHFELEEDATFTLLFAGGIGITPMLSMAHRLDNINAEFELHYSATNRSAAAFVDELGKASFMRRVRFHFSDEGSRLDVCCDIPNWHSGWHLYTCGPDRYMSAILDHAACCGWPVETLHREFFAVPEEGDYINTPFVLKLKDSDREVVVSADESASDALERIGIHIQTKCADGICGVCVANYSYGSVEHRDYVLSNAERKHKLTLCCSRAQDADGVIEIEI
ncbi:MAG: hypothetical protein DHS20C01_27430 [marine bacterium B5-7]|nr:MAG: hypothetical protein DHS20C01_27430 [marine bacterium B5-7]